MSNITHVIQERITIAQKMHKCHRCNHMGNILCISYEAATDAQRQEIEEITKKAARVSTLEETLKATFPVHDRVYEDTLLEQQHGLPQEHRRDLSCLPCTARFINELMNIGPTHIGELVLTRLRPQGAVWLIRDVSCPDRPGLIETPQQDVALLIQELREATTLRIRKA